MQNSTPIKEIDTLNKLLLVDLNVSIWSGRKKLRVEDLGGGINLPPAELASLGSKKIIDSDKLKAFENLKRRAIRLLEANGVRFLGGYGIPDDVAPEVAAELEAIKREFEAEKDSFINGYDSSFADWAMKWTNPLWKAAVTNAKTPKDVVAHKFGFRFTLCRVAPDSSSADLSKGLAQEVSGLSGQLFREIADAAEDLLDNSFVGKDSVTRKAVSAMLKMHKKLTSLAFLNPGVLQVADYMTNVISKLPKAGPYKGSEFQDLQSLMMTLSDETKILKLAGLFMKAGADASADFVDSTLSLPDQPEVDAFAGFEYLDEETSFDVLAGALDSAHMADTSSGTFASLMAGADLMSLNVNELAAMAQNVQDDAILNADKVYVLEEEIASSAPIALVQQSMGTELHVDDCSLDFCM